MDLAVEARRALLSDDRAAKPYDFRSMVAAPLPLYVHVLTGVCFFVMIAASIGCFA